MNEIPTLSATRQAELVRLGQISSLELVRSHLERIAEIQPALGAAVEVLAESAEAEARAADEAVASGEEVGPLHGVPFSAPPSTADAVVEARLRAAGAIPIARPSGGGNGGDAALVAACGSPMGLASDGAGCLRLSAAFSGVAALKPTSGRVPHTGHVPPAGGWIEALWQIGPMARQVDDLRTAMALLSGVDGCDPSVVDMGFPDPWEVSLGRLRVAWYTDNGIAAAGPEVAQVVRAAAHSLEDNAAAVEEARPACLERAYDLEMKLLGADGGDALRGAPPFLSAWLDRLPPYRIDLAGLQACWADWDLYRAQLLGFLRYFDVILCPAYPEAAPVDDPRAFSHTIAYNVAGWPAAVVRCGETDAGLPIAVQIAAPPWREDIALAVAGALEQIFGGWKAPAL